jgi:type IV pilus assembly protein PilW
MNTYGHKSLRSARSQRGFTLVELMVTVGIALFLLAGLVTIVQNVRQANLNQQSLALLQDEQRFAMTVITDAIQSAGYFGNPIGETTGTFGATAMPAPTAAFAAGNIFAGFHTIGALDAVAQDTLATRFIADQGYGPILCNGTDSSTVAGQTIYTILFSIDPVQHQLLCSVNGAVPAVQLVTGVTAMAIYYGVKRDPTNADYNVDTYLTWDQLLLAGGTLNGTNDFQSINSVRVVLTFANPLFGQPSQPATITMERVVNVMGRTGLHT